MATVNGGKTGAKRALTEPRKKFASLVAQGVKPTHAATVAGFASPRTEARRLLRMTDVTAAIHAEQEKVLLDLGAKALTTLNAAMDSPSEPIRLKAAEIVMREVRAVKERQVSEAKDEGGDAGGDIRSMDRELYRQMLQKALASVAPTTVIEVSPDSDIDGQSPDDADLPGEHP